MITSISTHHAAPSAVPVRGPQETQLALAVAGPGETDRTRGDGARERGAEALLAAREAQARQTDPDAPAGPPPAFAANVLEIERARLKEPRKDAEPDAPPEPEAKPAAAEAYSALPEGEAQAVDIAL